MVKKENNPQGKKESLRHKLFKLNLNIDNFKWRIKKKFKK